MTTGKRWMLLVAVVATCAAAALALFNVGRRPSTGGSGAPEPFPPPRAAAESSIASQADFTGAESCAGCHASQYARWRASTHGRAGGAPSAERVIAPFDGPPIRFKDAVVTPTVRGGRYLFVVAQQDRPPQTFQVDGVIGGGHMVGGGTQGFVTRWSDGTVRFLPFDFARKENAWFCNTSTRADHGWVLITPQMALADCGDWPPQRVLGDEPRFANCQSCHGSRIAVSFDTSRHAFRTSWSSLAIDCESCHGPGRAHVELARSIRGRTTSNPDIGMRSLTTLGKDASLAVCFQCHAVKDQVQPGFLPGAALASYYSVKMPLLGDRPFTADGRVRSFAYQQGHLYSACYRNGSMTCTSCHDPHAQRYRDVNGAPLAGRTDDRQCTGCHGSKADPIEAHTHHAAASPGSRCVSCHMPYLQQPELGSAVRYARSDHTIPIPRPGFDEGMGIQNACAQCHAGRSPDNLSRQVSQWYGEIKPLPAVVRALVESEATRDSARAMEHTLAPHRENHVIGDFAALARVVERSLAPDMPELPRAVLERIEALTASPDIDVRALALAALHYARGGDPAVRRLLIQRVAGLGADDDAVRRRWVLVLGFLGDSFRATGNAAAAIVTYRKALELLPSDASVLTNLGLAYTDAGDFPAAVDALRRSAAIAPDRSLTLVNLGVALEGAGDRAAAAAAYERAIALNPREALAWLDLGNIAFTRGDPERAVRLYEKAAEYDPARPTVFFNMARAYYQLGNARKALEALRRGLEFDPSNQEARQTVAQLEEAMKRR